MIMETKQKTNIQIIKLEPVPNLKKMSKREYNRKREYNVYLSF